MSLRFTSTCGQGERVEGSEKRGMEGKTGLLAVSVGSHGQATLQNTSRISGFVRETSSSQFRDSNSVIPDRAHPAATLRNSSHMEAGPFSTCGPRTMTEKSTQKPSVLHIHTLKPKPGR